MSQAISTTFQRLGAPLRVVRQSWGAVRETDGTVFLRVWQDESNYIFEGKRYVRVKRHGQWSSFGGTERGRHLALVQAGAPCFLIMCEVIDANASPRIIKRHNSREIFCTGELLEKDGDSYLELTMRRIAV